jgi:hypothetical protein
MASGLPRVPIFQVSLISPSFDLHLETHHPGQTVQKWLAARRAKIEERGVYQNTSSDEICSATPQMSVFQRSA